ncbi:MAG: histidine kinase [Bacteroidota bacterium]
MLRPNYKYLAFDDRWFMLLGIPFLSFIIPLVFFGVTWEEYITYGWGAHLKKLIYPASYWLFNRQLMINLRKRFDDFEQTPRRLVWQLSIIAVTVPLIAILVSGVLALWSIALGYSIQRGGEITLLGSLPGTYIIVLLMTFLYETIFLFHKYREAIEEKNKLQLAHVQGQLDNLRNQINPHFLFNSLNTLMSLIPQDTERAMTFLNKLSKFYRYTVSSQKEALIDVTTELENAAIYAELLHERFYKALEIELSDATSSHWQILPLSVQLLIENAVKHNIVSQRKPLQVRVYVDEATGYLWVANNVQLKIEEVRSTGVGLKNIRERITYFTDQPLQIYNENGCFRVAIPLLRKKPTNEVSNY